ncbi:MAG: flagellar motor protein MotA [Pseudomonadota bacterium]
MARANEAQLRFAGPGGDIFVMLAFLGLVGAVVFYLSPAGPAENTLLVDSFNANVPLNGLILGVLFIGIVYNLRQAGVVSPSIRWFQDAYSARRAPGFIRAAARILENQPLTTDSSRAILDSIGTRIDEGREMGRYIMNLLVFLGLLGTFWGLLETVNAVAATINGLATTGGAAEDAISQLISNLQEPLSGMGTAFSSSLFGLGGSLIVGFLDIRAGQAQNRFYTDLEDWLAGQAKTAVSEKGAKANLSASSDEAGDDVIAAVRALEAALSTNTETQIKAQAGQTAQLKDEIRALNRTLIRVGGGE